MRLKDVVHAEKNVTDWGKWASGTMPRTAFPLSRSRQNFYRLGSYRWRVVAFDALGEQFRLLICIHEPKEQFKAFLGLDRGLDTKFVGSLEFHGTHPGWHSVVSHESFDKIPMGIKAGPWQRRVPRARSWHRKRGFGVNERSACEKACEFFGLPVEKKQLDLLEQV